MGLARCCQHIPVTEFARIHKSGRKQAEVVVLLRLVATVIPESPAIVFSLRRENKACLWHFAGHKSATLFCGQYWLFGISGG